MTALTLADLREAWKKNRLVRVVWNPFDPRDHAEDYNAPVTYDEIMDLFWVGGYDIDPQDWVEDDELFWDLPEGNGGVYPPLDPTGLGSTSPITTPLGTSR
jgi:hypothetical protein